jgi:Protein of unknown function (DUF3048) N-terminal domain/Protein of unknown function (DUF3048) C-terminal domain
MVRHSTRAQRCLAAQSPDQTSPNDRRSVDQQLGRIIAEHLGTKRRTLAIDKIFGLTLTDPLPNRDVVTRARRAHVRGRLRGMCQADRMRRGVGLLVGLVVLVAACGGGHKHVAPTTVTQTTVKVRTVVARRTLPVAPLTGLADPLAMGEHRCAVTVKIDNTPYAHPHYGLEQADVIYEEVVEGGITRLAAIFNSQAPDRVGPVRSVRRTDQSLVWPLRGIFAYSGGAPYAIQSIDTAPVTQLDETRAGSTMFRDYTRRPPYDAPHNLYAHVDQMYKRCTDPAPPPLFTYRAAHSRVAGAPVTSIRVGFDQGYAVTWIWDPPTGTWKRSIFGTPEIAASGIQLSTTNVVVMFAQYAGGVGVEGAEATLIGYGTASVFTAGKVIKGTWIRPDKTKPAQLLDVAHHPIRLTPGPTWVELPDVSYTVTTTP